MTFVRDAQVGFLVGTFDVALLWPFVVLASRREAGSPSLKHSLKQGKLWSGGSGAVMMLVPYSIIVESLSNMNTANLASDGTLWQKLKTVPLTSFLIAFGLQPIEKKLVLDSLLQTERSGKGPVYDIVKYSQKHGMARLYGGFAPLWARETIYVCATMVLNPAWTSSVGDNASNSIVANCAKAFTLGFSAGMISAPCQTLSVMAKDERSFTTAAAAKEPLNVKRLFYGSMTRSVRTGAAGVLWYLARTANE